MKIINLLPIIVPLTVLFLIYIDSWINDFNPWQGEQGLGTIGAIFTSVVVGAVSPLVIIILKKIFGAVVKK